MGRTELIVEAARSWVGTPYHHQAALKGIGCDCVGLVRGVYQEVLGVNPKFDLSYSADWGDVNGNEKLIEAADKYLVRAEALGPGKVILLRMAKDRVAKHCMILTSPLTAIHAVNRNPVTEITLSSWWKNRIVLVYKFPGAT